MPAYLSPIGNSQIVDVNGNPLNGGKIYTYLAGTSTPAGTWTTSVGNIAQTNPIILNSLGATANPIFLSAGVAYKIIIKDSLDVATLYTFDNITGINDPAFLNVSGTLPAWVSLDSNLTYLSPTIFSASGDQTLILTKGRRIRVSVTSGTINCSVYSSVFSAGFTVVIVKLDNGGILDAGLLVLSYSIIDPEKPSLPNTYTTRLLLGIPQYIADNFLINSKLNINQDNRVFNTTTILAANEYWIDGWKAGSSGATVYYNTADSLVTISAGTLCQTMDLNELPQGSALLDYAGTSSYGFNQSGVTNVAANSPPISGIGVIVNIGISGNPNFVLGVGNFSTSSPLMIISGDSWNYPKVNKIQIELANCQRYHVRVTGIDGITGWGVGRSSTTSISRIWITPPVPMYAKPTVVFNGVLLDYLAATTAATAATVYSSKNEVMMEITHAAVVTAGQGCGLQIPNGVGNYIELNARL